MLKRKYPFEDCSRLQLKVYVDNKVRDEMSCDASENMQIVYDKTLRLLQEGSKTVSHRNPSSGSNIACECCSSALQLPLGGGQMLLDHNGQLHTGTILNTDCEDNTKYSVDIVDSMDVEGELEEDHFETLDTCDKLPAKTSTSMPNSSCTSTLIPNSSCTSTCHGCGRGLTSSGQSLHKCNWCCRTTCADCVRSCITCHQSYCPVCSIMNYDEYYERSFCLQCSSS